MTSRPVSSLARDADLLLLLPSAPEACPLGCAPTTSTTLMVALGDALAIALMRCKSFTPNDFRLRHPGGRLGRRLMRVENLLHGGRIMPLVHVDAPMSEVVLEMTRTGFGSTGVIDDHGLLIGAIHDGDVRRHMGPDLLTLRAGDIMSAVAVEIRPDMLACEAFGLMSTLGLVTAIVTEGARPVGILHVDDCRRAAVG